MYQGAADGRGIQQGRQRCGQVTPPGESGDERNGGNEGQDRDSNVHATVLARMTRSCPSVTRSSSQLLTAPASFRSRAFWCDCRFDKEDV